MGNPDSDALNDKNGADENVMPKAPPRDNLIDRAVTFLSDRKIIHQDPSMVRKFLLKKGLTEEEVSIAFQKSEFGFKRNQITEYERLGDFSGHFAPPPPLPPPPVPSTMWHTVHGVVTTITSIGGIIYAIYWLWKTYISPYLFGRKTKKKSVETSLTELEAAVAGCVTDMKTIRSSLEVLAEQRTVDFTQGVLVNKIQEVKSEVNSLKTLLLSRNQFPALPTPMGNGSISIPAWQLESETNNPPEAEGEGEAEEEGSGSNGTTNGSDSSLEIVKDPNN